MLPEHEDTTAALYDVVNDLAASVNEERKTRMGSLISELLMAFASRS
jgi:hypothetical protein